MVVTRLPVATQQDGLLPAFLSVVHGVWQETPGPECPKQVIELHQLFSRSRIHVDLVIPLKGLFRQTTGKQGACGVFGVREKVEINACHCREPLVVALAPVEQELRQ
jgi:hypothetical protein